jgi:hypothetical protein
MEHYRAKGNTYNEEKPTSAFGMQENLLVCGNDIFHFLNVFFYLILINISRKIVVISNHFGKT